MEQVDPRIKDVFDRVSQEIRAAAERPFIVSVMGQTGVGKSSLINALFQTTLKTDPIRPCTKDVQKVVVTGTSGSELWFYDLPGIGESEHEDGRYLDEYRSKLAESDVVLWAMHADNRSVAFDFNALSRLLGPTDEDARSQMSKLTFVLTKADLLTPPPWLFAKIRDRGSFVPHPDLSSILDEKEHYFHDVFIGPFGHLITSQTYNDSHMALSLPSFQIDQHTVSYQGLLRKQHVTELAARFPRYAHIFQRLYDNYRVIPCSSLFRYNLDQLMVIIINKLGMEAIHRLETFVRPDVLRTVLLEQATTFGNIVIVDPTEKKVLFDLTQMPL